jgi:6-phosphogluconolactonase
MTTNRPRRGRFAVEVFADVNNLYRAAAETIVQTAASAVRKRGVFLLGLSGGRTPVRLYQLIADRYASRIPWAHTQIFWTDERCVPRDDTASNYRLVQEHLLDRINIPAAQVHPIPTDVADPAAAAQEYELTLRSVLERSQHASRTLDLAILGVGEDGHTASLFPGDAASVERRRWVQPACAPPRFSPQQRITVTFPMLNRSGTTLVLAIGKAKREVIAAVARNPDAQHQYPIARVRAANQLRWLIDREAAELMADSGVVNCIEEEGLCHEL